MTVLAWIITIILGFGALSLLIDWILILLDRRKPVDDDEE